MSRYGKLEIVLDDPAIGIATAGSLFIVDIRQTATHESIGQLERAHGLWRKRCGQKLSMLTLVPESRLPNNDVKTEIVRCFRALSAENACSATLIGGVGFWASAARSTLTGAALLARPSCPTKTFGDVSSALSWMESITELRGQLLGLTADIDKWREPLAAATL